MNFEDQLGHDLKVLGDSQQVPTGTNLDVIGRTVAARRRRTTGAGMAAGAAVLGLAAFFGAGLVGNDTAPVQTVDNNGNVVSDIADTPESPDAADVDESGTGTTDESSQPVQPAVVPDDTADAPADPQPADVVFEVVVGSDGEFVSIGADSDHRVVIERSTNGADWLPVTAVGLPTNAIVHKFVQLRDTGDFVAVLSSNGAVSTAHSTDLETWSVAEIEGLPAPEDPASSRSAAGVSLVDAPTGVLIIATMLEFNDEALVDLPPVDVDCPDADLCEIPSPIGIPELPEPVSIAAISSNGGRSFAAVELSGFVDGHAMFRDGRFVVEGTAMSGSRIAVSSVDGLTWVDAPAPEFQTVSGESGTTEFGGVAWRALWDNGSSDLPTGSRRCCSIQRSTNGGTTWETTATSDAWTDPADLLFLIDLEAGAGGLVASGFLTANGPDADLLNLLGGPPVDVVFPVGDYSLVFAQTSSFGQDPVIMVQNADGATIFESEFDNDAVQCCQSGVFTVTLDDGTLLEATVEEIRQSVGTEPFIAIEKEGWLVELDLPLTGAAFISLRNVDGTYADAWHLSVLDGSIDASTPGIAESADGDLVFTDRDTGEHLVTFTEAEGEAAAAQSDLGEFTVASADDTEPSAAIDAAVFFHSFDGVTWTQLDAGVSSDFAALLAVGDDELIIGDINQQGEMSRVRVPLPPRG